MEDIDIIKQLFQGNHLEPLELSMADNLIFMLKMELKRRLKQ